MRTVSLFREQLIPAWAGKTGSITSNASDPKAHPRMGGENGGCTRAGVTTSGSSPRGRGKPGPAVRVFLAVRLIPARAGKTRASRAWMTTGGAHPRAGGENDGDEADPMSIHGSSPRGRGKRPPTGLGRSYRWLIPARAGKTCGEASAAGSDWAHPRAGGENSNISVALSAHPGSSPRGRGKPLRHNVALDQARLIPARAGKTAAGGQDARRSRAHPRAGGENQGLFPRQ